eukprot:2603920-Prymnesium_polylepis.1
MRLDLSQKERRRHTLKHVAHALPSGWRSEDQKSSVRRVHLLEGRSACAMAAVKGERELVHNANNARQTAECRRPSGLVFAHGKTSPDAYIDPGGHPDLF